MILSAIFHFFKTVLGYVIKITAWLLVALSLWVPLLYALIFIIICGLTGTSITAIQSWFWAGLALSFIGSFFVSTLIYERRIAKKKRAKAEAAPAAGLERVKEKSDEPLIKKRDESPALQSDSAEQTGNTQSFLPDSSLQNQGFAPSDTEASPYAATPPLSGQQLSTSALMERLKNGAPDLKPNDTAAKHNFISYNPVNGQNNGGGGGGAGGNGQNNSDNGYFNGFNGGQNRFDNNQNGFDGGFNNNQNGFNGGQNRFDNSQNGFDGGFNNNQSGFDNNRFDNNRLDNNQSGFDNNRFDNNRLDNNQNGGIGGQNTGGGFSAGQGFAQGGGDYSGLGRGFGGGGVGRGFSDGYNNYGDYDRDKGEAGGFATGEKPNVFATRSDPTVLIYEYSDRLEYYKRTRAGLLLFKTRQKEASGG